jgi:putative transposase
MARLARAVAPGIPHHITQRGNRRQAVFFSDEDYALYRTLLSEQCFAAGIKALGYCLMPNHVHLILVPPDERSLADALAQTHRRYTRDINFRKRWTGHLWQGRFASFAMDDAYLMACVRYVELNPVRANLAAHPFDWPWSSARAHLSGMGEALAERDTRFEAVADWAAFLGVEQTSGDDEAMRASSRTGRPLGDAAFVMRLERALGRALGRRKPGPKPKAVPLDQPQLL